MPRLRKVSCIREYSPLSSIIAPLIGFALVRRAVGRVVGDPGRRGWATPNRRARGDVVGDVAEVAALDAHRQVDRGLEVGVRDLRRHGRPA